jgi:hypothetical protein
MRTYRRPDGIEYEVVEPDDPPRPPHDSDACGQCTFVADKTFIYATPAQREAAAITPLKMFRWSWGVGEPEDAIIGLGRFMLPGWHDHAMFYLLECRNCYQQYVDSLHGNNLYLRCPDCHDIVRVTQERFFKEEGKELPPTPWQRVRHAWHLRRELGPRKHPLAR